MVLRALFFLCLLVMHYSPLLPHPVYQRVVTSLSPAFTRRARCLPYPTALLPRLPPSSFPFLCTAASLARALSTACSSRVCVCVCLLPLLPVSLSFSLSFRVCVYFYVCAFVCMCACVFVCVCVHVRVRVCFDAVFMFVRASLLVFSPFPFPPSCCPPLSTSSHLPEHTASFFFFLRFASDTDWPARVVSTVYSGGLFAVAHVRRSVTNPWRRCSPYARLAVPSPLFFVCLIGCPYLTPMCKPVGLPPLSPSHTPRPRWSVRVATSLAQCLQRRRGRRRGGGTRKPTWVAVAPPRHVSPQLPPPRLHHDALRVLPRYAPSRDSLSAHASTPFLLRCFAGGAVVR